MPINDFGLPEGFHRSDLLHEGVVKRILSQDELHTNPYQQTPQTQPTQDQDQAQDQTSASDPSEGLVTDTGPLLILDERLVRQAYVPLDFREGFPTLPNSGQPFWDQLDFESAEAYKAFERYLKQGTDKGARRLFALACDPSIHKLTLGETLPLSPPPQQYPHQQFETPTLSESQEIEQYNLQKSLSQRANRKLQEWFTLYYWGPRARAHDLFYLDSIHQGQKMLALQLQNTHLTDAQHLYSQVMDFIRGDNVDYQDANGKPRFWNEMTPRVLVDFMKVLHQISRVSVGLPSNGPASMDSPASVASMLRSLMATPSLGSSGSPPFTPPGPSNGGGPGRPRVTYDDQNNRITHSSSQDRSHQLQPQPSLQQRPQQQLSQGGDISDEDRARRIARIFNAAKARREANQPQVQQSQSPTTSTSSAPLPPTDQDQE